METALCFAAILAYFGFRHWLRHNRRMMIHRERLAAIEKGVELPPVEQEVKRNTWNIQRIILLTGLIWISLGVAAFVTLSVVLAYGMNTRDLPPGIQWVAIAPVGIGLSHLLVYLAGRNKEN